MAEQERRAKQAKEHAERVKRRIAKEQKENKRKADGIARKIQGEQRAQEQRAEAAKQKGRRTVERIEGRRP
jgi:hypothetical protein